MGRERIYRYAKRTLFTGTFVRYGVHKRRGCRTALVVDILDQYQERIADHIWIDDAGKLVHNGVEAGDEVLFSAIPYVFLNGYIEEEFHQPIRKDYKLQKVFFIRIIHRQEEEIEDGKNHQAHRNHGKNKRRFNL